MEAEQADLEDLDGIQEEVRNENDLHRVGLLIDQIRMDLMKEESVELLTGSGLRNDVLEVTYEDQAA